MTRGRPANRTAVSYDGANRILRLGGGIGARDTLINSYSVLGYLVATRQRQKGIAERLGDSLHYKSQDTVVVDGLGNLQTRLSGDTTRVWIGGALQNSSIKYSLRTELYRAHVGRDTLNNNTQGGRQRILYDSAGNVVVMSKIAGSLDAIHEDRLSYYDAAGKLVAAEMRQDDFAASRRSVTEDYRYDALGRRVWVRAQRNVPAHTNPMIEYFVSFTRRTVWDGEQEIAEIQMPGDPAHSTWFENDTGTVTPVIPKVGGLVDLNPYYGRVIYTHGLATDKPLSATRYKYYDGDGGGLWPTYSLLPFWNLVGQAAGGAFSNGQAFVQKAAGGTHCRTVPLSQRCVAWDWPGARTAYNARSGHGSSSFQGTLLEDKQDAAGTFFRRNRVYDPATGRFTQEDPIGLAGGLNLYGFANGDPVNFSDPFGLYPGPIHLGFIGSAIKQAQDDWFLDQAAMVMGATAPLARVSGRVVPAVANSKLGNIVRDLFKGTKSSSPIGTGSTADAIRNEALTGQPTGGTFHTDKGTQYVRSLEKWLKKNASADDRDQLVARSLLDDLREALSRTKKNP